MVRDCIYYIPNQTLVSILYIYKYFRSSECIFFQVQGSVSLEQAEVQQECVQHRLQAQLFRND